MKLLYHEAAEQELLSEVAYLEDRASGLGRRFLQEIRRIEVLLLSNPEANPEARPGLRTKVMKSFRYSIVYSLETEGVLILAIAHHRRRPFYWLGRATSPEGDEP